MPKEKKFKIPKKKKKIGYPGPPPEGTLFPPVPLMENEKIIEQPVNLSSVTDRYTEKGIEFIKRNVENNTPFFLYMAYEQPHVPLFVSPEFNNISRRGLYGDCVTEIDASIGSIHNVIKQLNIENNTIIIISSDNGAWINPDSGTIVDPSVTVCS